MTLYRALLRLCPAAYREEYGRQMNIMFAQQLSEASRAQHHRRPAQPARVVTMILRETARVILVGLAAGACLTYSASLLINGRLCGVAPQDPLTLTSATTRLLLVALSAACLPALSAAKLDPMEALRRPD